MHTIHIPRILSCVCALREAGVPSNHYPVQLSFSLILYWSIREKSLQMELPKAKGLGGGGGRNTYIIPNREGSCSTGRHFGFWCVFQASVRSEARRDFYLYANSWWKDFTSASKDLSKRYGQGIKWVYKAQLVSGPRKKNIEQHNRE